MKKVELGVATLSLLLMFTGCTSDNGKIQELENRIEQLEQEKEEFIIEESEVSKPVESEQKKGVESNIGTRSNPVEVGKQMTFNPLYSDQEVEITATIKDIIRGAEAESEINEYDTASLEAFKQNIGGLQENTEFMTYTITIKPKGVNKDEGIKFPGNVKSLTIDGDDLGYSNAISNVDGFSNYGQVYVDKEYTYRMYGKIEKGKEGLISFIELNSKVFFKVN